MRLLFLPLSLILLLKCNDAYESEQKLEKLIDNSEEMADIERTSKFLEKLRQLDPPVKAELSPETEKVEEQMMKLVEDRVERGPSIGEINKEFSDHLFEGDIILSPDMISAMDKQQIDGEKRDKRATAHKDRRLWPKNETLYFTYGAGYDEEARILIRQKISELDENTCLKFEEGTGPKMLHFERGHGCVSYIGYYRNNQSIWVDYGCDGAIQHEVM
ncbi:hypothetical protein PFISCL1PPCAC_6954, partial [Pristionchus fissidentatus]